LSCVSTYLGPNIQTVSINGRNSSNSCWVNWTGSPSRRSTSIGICLLGQHRHVTRDGRTVQCSGRCNTPLLCRSGTYTHDQ
jgi:hypothetical protein